MSNTETVAEYLARGGKITSCAPGNGTTVSEFVNKDAMLKELRKLARVTTDPDMKFEIEKAIDKRYSILKCSF